MLDQTFKLDRASSIHGWMSGPELQFLAETASKCKFIAEAGSYKGRSTRALADNTEGIVFAVDPWDGKYQVYGKRDYGDEAFLSFHQNGNNEIYSEFYMNLYDHIQNKKVIINRMNFTEFKSPVKFDFIFIDAIHEYEALKQDIAHALTMIKHGGIIGGHDYMSAWPGVPKAVDEIFPEISKVETIWYTTI